MKKQKLMAVMVLTAFAGLFVSCVNDDSNSCVEDYTGTLSEAETAFAGTWELTAIESSEEVDITDDDEDNPSTDIYAQQTDCQNDQQYTYNPDRTFKYTAGENETDCSNPSSLTGTWKLGGDTLGLVYSCLENIATLEFNAERTSYSFDSNARVEDVDGKVSQVELTFTYTKVGVEEETTE